MITEAKGRAIVMERSGGRCELCGAQGDGVHHRLKRSAGGTWSPTNLIRLCGSGTTGCHGRIEAEPVAAKALGLWLVNGPDDLEVVPMLCRPHLFGLDWWRSDDEGVWVWHDRALPSELRRLATLIGPR